jgi:hypothetical protein
MRFPAMLSVSLSFSAVVRTFLKKSPHCEKLSSLPVSCLVTSPDAWSTCHSAEVEKGDTGEGEWYVDD